MAKVTFNNSGQQFFQSVKRSVDSYFKENKIKKTGNWKLYTKTAVLVPFTVFIYIYLLTASYGPWGGIILSVIFGLALVSIAFNVMHDACHGSFSSKKWVNEVMGLSMNALGSNAFLWKIKHNIIHHTYTNVDGIDDDIAKHPLLRLCPSQKWFPGHRYQFIYLFFLYSISTFAWLLASDYVKYFKKKINSTPISAISKKEHFIFWISKALYAVFYIVIPIMVLGWAKWLIGYSIMMAVMGFVLSIVFQLAHVVEKTSFELADEENAKVIDTEWAVHELMTTADFAPGNKIVTWFTGGLNFQVIHHLFPRISHVHYPAIQKIVRRECARFNLPYHYYPTMMEAIMSHIRLMKKLGDKNFTPQTVELSKVA